MFYKFAKIIPLFLSCFLIFSGCSSNDVIKSSNIEKDLIPVVPATHFLCGGINKKN